MSTSKSPKSAPSPDAPKPSSNSPKSPNSARLKSSKSTKLSPRAQKYANANLLSAPLLDEMDPRSIIFAEVHPERVTLYILHHGHVKLFLAPASDAETYHHARRVVSGCEYLDHFCVNSENSDTDSNLYHQNPQSRHPNFHQPDPSAQNPQPPTDLYLKQFIKLATDPDRQAFVFFHGPKKFLLECSSKYTYELATALLARRRTLNTQLFSANFFKNHHYTAPILEDYFGKIGYEFFRASAASGQRNLVPQATLTLDVSTQPEALQSTLAQPSTPRDSLHPAQNLNASARSEHDSAQTLAPLLQTLNCIPPEDLSHPDLSVELEQNPDFSLTDSYVHHFFVDLAEENLARLVFTDLQHRPLRLTPADFDRAVTYLRYQDNQLFNLHPSHLESCRRSFQEFQAAYLLAHLSRDQLQDFVDYFFDLDYLPDHIGQFTTHLTALAGVDFMAKFSHLPVKTPAKFTSFAKLCEYPALIHFNSNTNRNILQKILKNQLPDEEILYFFINFSHTLDHHNLATLQPALRHLALTTQNPAVFAQVCRFLDLTRAYLPADQLPAFEQQVFEVFWPRIGSLWPVIHLHDFNFSNAAGREIFLSALDVLMSLDTLTNLSPEFAAYFDQLDQNPGLEPFLDLPLPVARKFFQIQTATITPAAKFRLAFQTFPAPVAIRLLARPAAPADLEPIFHDALHTPPHRQLLHNHLALIEQILVTPQSEEVSTHLLEYIKNNFSDFVNLAHRHPLERFDQILNLFTAACAGAAHSAALPLLKTFATRLRALQNNAKDAIPKLLRTHREELITSALAQAKLNIKTATFQRKQSKV